MTQRGGSRQAVGMRCLLLMICGGIVLGMFGMHSLTQNHAVASNQVSAAYAPSIMVTADTAQQTLSLSSEHGDDHRDSTVAADHCGMLWICLLAIAAGAALLWFLRSPSGRRPITHLKRVATVGRVFIQTVFRPPPDLISLSILRC